MKLFILDADNSKDMEDISEELFSKKFKIIEKDDNFILMMKRRYGNLLIHAVCLFISMGISPCADNHRKG